MHFCLYSWLQCQFQASETELLWLQRAAILILGAIATVVSTSVHIIYGLFVLAGDIVSVIVFPQLTAALFLRFTNAYGALTGLILSLILRLGAGEPNLNFDYFIYYPWYDDEAGQIFPFRVFAMIISFLAIITISFLTNFLFRKGLLSQKFDVMRCSVNGTQPNSQQEQNKSPTTNDDFIRNNYTTSYLWCLKTGPRSRSSATWQLNFDTQYRNVPKFSDRQVWANIADPDQTQIRLLRVYTVCHSVCIIWTHYSMVEPHSSNFRVITTNVLGVRYLGNLRYMYNDQIWVHVSLQIDNSSPCT